MARYLVPLLFSGAFSRDCKHGIYKPDTKSCDCDEHWATAGITDTVDFLEGVCEQYQCIDDATCKEILNLDDFDVSCPIPKWNCYCGWKYAFKNSFHGYEVSKSVNSTGAECMGAMYTFSVWSTLTVWWLMKQTLWMVLILTLVCIPIGKKRIRCDHHDPCLSSELRRLCGHPPSCPGGCSVQNEYGWDNLMDDFAWSSYVVSVGSWVLAFLSILYVMALFVWSIVLWAMVLVLLVVAAVAGLCMLCEGGAGHCDCNCSCNCDCCGCDPGVGLHEDANLVDVMYWGGPHPIDGWYYCDCSGLAGTPEDSCCGCSCRGCCFPIAWLILRFPRMPENMWGGGLGYVLGTHSRSQRRCQGCDPLIDCLGMLWIRSSDLHENDDWRRNVHDFLYDSRYTAELPYHDIVESRGSDQFHVGYASGEFINRSFDDSDGCVPSSFEDYMNNKCWICQTGNIEWDLWVVCRHMFCKRCSEEMLRRRMPCPLCRVFSTRILRGNALDV